MRERVVAERAPLDHREPRAFQQRRKRQAFEGRDRVVAERLRRLHDHRLIDEIGAQQGRRKNGPPSTSSRVISRVASSHSASLESIFPPDGVDAHHFGAGLFQLPLPFGGASGARNDPERNFFRGLHEPRR